MSRTAHIVTREGRHVSLRRGSPDDAEMVFRWRSDPVARRYQPLRDYSLDEVRGNLVARAGLSVDSALAGEVQWIVLADGAPVGWLTLKVLFRDHGVGELGYTIATAHHRRGYASAAVQLILPIAFSPSDGADLWRIEASAAVDNLASRTVLARAGFHLEGIARQSAIIDGVRVDHARYALLRPDWEASSPPAKLCEPD